MRSSTRRRFQTHARVDGEEEDDDDDASERDFGGTQQTKRDAVKKATNRHSLEQILQKADEETRSTCTFQPKTIAKGYLEEDSERRKARRERLLQSRLDIVRERSGEERGGEGNVREGVYVSTEDFSIEKRK